MTESNLVLQTSPDKPLVFVRDRTVSANSRDVAERFDKRHADVLRAVDALVSQLPPDQRSFALVEYQDGKGEFRRSFDMNRDGFTLLVMGFTGKPAFQWKLKYIDAFNRMEEQLQRQGVIPNFQDPETAAEAWLAEYRAKKAAEQRVALLEPKEAALERIAESKGEFPRRVAAQLLQVSEKFLTEWLLANRWINRPPGERHHVLYDDKRKRGLAVLKFEEIPTGERVPVVKLTPRGLAEIGMALYRDEPQKLYPLLAQLGFDRKLLGAPS